VLLLLFAVDVPCR